jgi:hypothetical protein
MKKIWTNLDIKKQWKDIFIFWQEEQRERKEGRKEKKIH